ncbi:MAG: hypothetical protein AB1847_05535 [bacterium]
MMKGIKFRSFFFPALMPLIALSALIGLAALFIDWQVPAALAIESPPLDMQLPMMGNALKTARGDILLDNFEYWDSPLNHGWHTEEPSYPVFGGGVGYGMLNCVIDFEEGSKVLDVYRPASVFLPFDSQYMPYTITKSTYYPNGDSISPIDANNAELSFKVRAPIAFDSFNTFSFIIFGTTQKVFASGSNAGQNHSFQLVLIPRESPNGNPGTGINALDPNSVRLEVDPTIMVYLGRQFQDGTWHAVTIDIKNAVDKATGESLKEISAIQVRGNQYRLDDIIFFKKSPYENRAPYLFRIGSFYPLLFDQTGQYSTRLIFAEDPDLGLWCFDPNGKALCYDTPRDQDTRKLTMLDVPDEVYRNYKDENLLYYTDSEGKRHFVDGSKGDPLTFRITVGGAGANGIEASSLISRIPLTYQDPTSGLQLPIPDFGNFLRNYYGISALPKWRVPLTQWLAGDDCLKNLQYALLNSGFSYLPNVVVLRMQEQVLEDLIVTCEVTDGRLSDIETFPVSVVNYPVTNHPPRIEQLSDQCFEVGKIPSQRDRIMGGFTLPGQTVQISQAMPDQAITNVYTVTATDPDPGDILIYSITLNGLPSYQYGPWMENIIDPYRGVISFNPQFEGVFQCVVTVRDSRGLSAMGSFNIFCINSGSWLNHPPIILETIQSPQQCRAGELFTLSELRMFDPDGQKLFYSCNIGAVSDNGVFTFQTQFPGQYSVQITGYDSLGGYVIQSFVLDVTPWWSF